MVSKIDRRSFIKKSAAAAAGVAFITPGEAIKNIMK
jgi:hypothetical protein